ncbi:hypothetical protein GCM10023065_31680 [Microbacterium laevaniformans]
MDDLEARRDRVDGLGIADDGGRPPAEIVRRLVEQQAAVVDRDDVLEEVRDLVDQVAGQDDRARVLCIVLEEPVVEDLAGDGIQAEVRLVEERDLRAGREADDDADGRQLSA